MNKNDKKYFKEMIEDNDLFHVSIPMTVLGGLQYDFTKALDPEVQSFNTDDGIRRAAMKKYYEDALAEMNVSIPMTVLGGLQ